MLVLEGLVGLHRTIQLQLLQHCWSGHSLDYRDTEWFALETNGDHSSCQEEIIGGIMNVKAEVLPGTFVSRSDL